MRAVPRFAGNENDNRAAETQSRRDVAENGLIG